MDASGAVEFVGRETELGVVREVLSDLERGVAAAVVVEGEAGIGKTALVRHLIAGAVERGVRVMRGEARAFERNRPYGALVGALDLRPRSSDPSRAAVGRLLVGVDGSHDATTAQAMGDVRFRVLEAVLELLEGTCVRSPSLLVVEDLHWADESTLSAVAAIVHELAHVPLLVVVTLRPAPRSRAVDILVDACTAAGARFLRLEPLDRAAVEALVEVHLGGRVGARLGAIVERAGGNPLLLVELCRSLVAEGWLKRDADVVDAAADELPSTLRDLVLRRMRYLPDRTLDVLRLASVLGEAVSLRDLAAAARRDAAEVGEDLAEAFRAKLLDERGEVVAFRHQLVQQAIYEDLPMPMRRALHRDAAGALADAGADLPTVVGQLLLGAERGDLEAVRWLRRAAVEAAAGAPSVAVDLTRRALELLPAGHSETDVVTAELAAALYRAGQVAEAATVAAEVLDRPHRSEVDVRLQLTLVDSLSLQNRPAELIARAEAALRTPTLALSDHAFVLTQVSYGQIFSGDYLGAEATARRALELGERSGSAEMACWSRCALSVAVKEQGRYPEALEVAQRAVVAALDPPDQSARLRHPHFFLGMTLAHTDDFEGASVAYQQAIDDARRFGTGWLLPDMLLQAAELRFITGEWEDAAVELEAGLELALRHGQQITVPQSCAYLSLMCLAKGDVSGARVALERLGGTPTSDEPVYGTEMAAVAASAIAAAEHDAVGALEVLLPLWHYDEAREIRHWHAAMGPPIVRLAVALGRVAVAENVVATVEAGLALAPAVKTVAAAARRCRGVLEADPEALVEAVELGRTAGHAIDHPATCEDAATALVAAGRHEHARRLLEEAFTEYERIGAVAWGTRVVARLRAIGVRLGVRGPRRRPEHGWESLTAGERAVSELVAQGLTNREVGRRLHISPHTVNTHLRHVFQKLSVATRTELAGKVPKGAQITQSSDVSHGRRGAP